MAAGSKLRPQACQPCSIASSIA